MGASAGFNNNRAYRPRGLCPPLRLVPRTALWPLLRLGPLRLPELTE
jgi:hypothetical protein